MYWKDQLKNIQDKMIERHMISQYSDTSDFMLVEMEKCYLNPGDYHLQSTSPAIDAGVSLSEVTHDLDGNPRSGIPDIGAYEYTSGSVTTTTTLPGQFTVSGFSCSPIYDGHRCSINYNNNLGENAVLVFLYTNNQGKVVSAGSPSVAPGSGSTATNLYCSAFGPGTYSVYWKAYLERDEDLSDTLAMVKSDETQSIEC